jgi:hypothetical protein
METIREMSAKDETPFEDLLASLERFYIESYLGSKGYALRDLLSLPSDTARKLRIDASFFACSKLTEMETRSRLIRQMHGEF